MVQIATQIHLKRGIAMTLNEEKELLRSKIESLTQIIKIAPLLKEIGIDQKNYYPFMKGQLHRLSLEKVKLIYKTLEERLNNFKL